MSGPRNPKNRWLAIGQSAALALLGILVGVHASVVSGAGSGSVTGHVRASPLTITLTTSANATPTGGTIKAEARLSNLGTTTLRSISVELRADRTGLSIKGAVVTIAQLKPGKVATVSWSVCGASAGSYVLLARATEAGGSVDSGARLLSVVPSRKTCR